MVVIQYVVNNVKKLSYDENKDIYLVSDASQEAAGGVVLQRQKSFDIEEFLQEKRDILIDNENKKKEEEKY